MNSRNRRSFLKTLAGLTLTAATGRVSHAIAVGEQQSIVTDSTDDNSVTVFLCGDVMTGRGIDQVMPQSVHPRLYEPFVKNARAYVNLAERKSGPIPRSVDYSYIWGDALSVLDQRTPAARIINLETAVTDHDEPWPGKGINYRMHPGNVPCLTAAGIDCCVLANNHVLDWGYPGLQQTLATLQNADIKTAGAGQDCTWAAAPTIINLPHGRILIFGYGHLDSGIPGDWRASADRGGVNLLTDLSDSEIEHIAKAVRSVRKPNDIVIVSIHWGGNWGYQVPLEHQRFAHGLIDTAGIDIVHGHSSHHPKGIEIYRNRPVFYGCGDFLNDYEGIGGHEEYRSELTLMYLPRLNRTSGELMQLELVPMRMERFRLHHANDEEANWLAGRLNREGKAFGTRARLNGSGTIGIHQGNET